MISHFHFYPLCLFKDLIEKFLQEILNFSKVKLLIEVNRLDSTMQICTYDFFDIS